MEKYRCCIVEDEPVSRSILSYYVSQVPELELVGEFSNPFEAKAAIEKDLPDVLFLDINLGSMSGLELAEMVNEKAVVIFTTASRDHASEAFSLNAVDYLLKPYEKDRFTQAVNKAKVLMEVKKKGTSSEDFLFIKDSRGLTKLNIKDIIYVEALGDYLKLHTAEKFFTMLGTMKHMEEKLKPYGFIRVHRSYLVALHYVKGIEGALVLVGNYKVRVSESNRSDLLTAFNPKKT